ncbi:hypothetical protein MHZ92_08135 [Sporosarcina sp. ACRSL]|nr:hypothetical protein [Sporosarcina sp. ACRSL]
MFSDSLEVLPEKMKSMLKQLACDDAFILEEVGNKWTEYGRYKEALSSFKKADTIKPTAQLSKKIGETLFHLGKYADAIPYLEKAKSMDAKTYLLLGRCYERLGNVDQTTLHFRKAYGLGRGDTEIIEAIALHFYDLVNQNNAHDTAILDETIGYFRQLVNDRLEKRTAELAKFNGKYFFNDKDLSVLKLANLYLLKEAYELTIDCLDNYISLFPYTSKKDIYTSIKSGKLLIYLSEDLNQEKQKRHEEKTADFFQYLFAHLYELKARCHHHLGDDDAAEKMVAFAKAFDCRLPNLPLLERAIRDRSIVNSLESKQKEFDQLNEQIAILTEQFHVLQTQTTERMDKLEQDFETYKQELDKKLETISTDLKGYVDARFSQYTAFLEKLTAFPDWHKRMEYLEELLTPGQFRDLKQFDEATEESVKRKFSDDDDIQNMARIIDVWATGEWLYRHYEDFFNHENPDGMDTSFIAISYFKTLEVTLAKKIGELSKGAELVEYNNKEKKVRVALDYKKNPIEVGDAVYYHQTIGKYNGFIRNFSKYEKYEENLDPLHPDYRKKRDQLAITTNNFTKVHRNKCSHKSILAVQQVAALRNEFNALMLSLLKSFRR